VTIHGHVQGVFFRDGCRSEAERRGVRGWVSNEPDGTVRAHLEGDPSAVRAVLDWCRIGPPRARVDDVDEREVDPEGLSGFTVR
jgi:acylphosphatase